MRHAILLTANVKSEKGLHKMVKSMFAAISGLQAHQSKMDVISNNIANVNTWGFKTRTANFQDAVYQNVTNGAGGNPVEGGTGGVNSSQLGYGVNMGSISTNFATGSWGYTGHGMNAMIDGTGFFIVGGWPEGDPTDPTTFGVESANLAAGGVNLSRVGIFRIDNQGCLVDDSGSYVYGFSLDPAAPNGDGTGTQTPADNTGVFSTDLISPIQIPIEDDTTTPPTRYDIQSVEIGVDGTVTGIDADNNKVTIGKIAVASVENINGLDQSAGYYYTIGANAGTATAIQTTQATGMIRSNYLEMSNVDLATDIANMITTQRGYQANTKIITVTDQMLEELVNMKR